MCCCHLPFSSINTTDYLWLVVDSGIYTHTCCVCAGIDIQQHLVENFGGLNASGGSLVFRHCTARHGGGLDAQVLSVPFLDRWKMGVTWHYPKIKRLCNQKGGFVFRKGNMQDVLKINQFHSNFRKLAIWWKMIKFTWITVAIGFHGRIFSECGFVGETFCVMVSNLLYL